jgi:pimeloyl-ACP methyl ester carboxylesterase
MAMRPLHDHRQQPVEHHRLRVNGIRMHVVTAGEGEPLLLVHGTPKTHTYWSRLIPLLTERFQVVAPDLRGFGDTDRPPAEEGYDSETNAHDLAQVMTALGHDRFHLHGEDRGAEFAYVLAATQQHRVKTLSFAEMLLSGLGLEERSFFTSENVLGQLKSAGAWQWHIPFFWLPNVPEALITGKEREFWAPWIKAETWDPSAISDELIDDWIAHIKAPGGLRGVLETYRAAFRNAETNQRLAADKITMPVSAIGAPEFFSNLVGDQMRQVAANVEVDVVFERCGHSLALEAPDRLAQHLIEFMSGR